MVTPPTTTRLLLSALYPCVWPFCAPTIILFLFVVLVIGPSAVVSTVEWRVCSEFCFLAVFYCSPRGSHSVTFCVVAGWKCSLALSAFFEPSFFLTIVAVRLLARRDELSAHRYWVRVRFQLAYNSWQQIHESLVSNKGKRFWCLLDNKIYQ